MKSLLLDEARARATLLQPTAYDVSLDLASDRRTFPSTTRIAFRSEAGETFLDLKPVSLQEISLDGNPLDVAALDEGRYPLTLTEGEHTLVVEATMPFRNDGEGLHRSTDPVDGRDYVYGMSFMDAAPTIFACFDQPDLKAPYTLHVKAPDDWLVAANAPGKRVGGSTWEFEESRPLSTYFVTVVAGPYYALEGEHDGIPLRLLCRQSLAEALDADADELFTTTKNAFDAFHAMFGVRYPFGKYDQAFVPEFNAGAMENPGCVTLRDTLLFGSRVERERRIRRATILCHEMAHQWFGNIVTPRWWDDLWLNESFADYAGIPVAAQASPYDDAMAWYSAARKNWGLTDDTRPSTHPVAGNGAVNALAALQDFDGISYCKGSAVLRQLAERIGEDVFLTGVRDHIESHAFGNATLHDLFASWEAAGAGDLSDWTSAWLLTAGPDEITLDRAAGELVRTPPAGRPAEREHDLVVAAWNGSTWEQQRVGITGSRTPYAAGDRPVVLDATDVDWALLTFDATTAAALPGLMPTITEPRMRRAVWNTVQSAVHQATLDPATALDIVCAGLPGETSDPLVSALIIWAPDLLTLTRDPAAARTRLHEAFTQAGRNAPPDSLLRLSALIGGIATSASLDGLRAALDGRLPPGIVLDRDLRWRIVRRITQLGGADRDFLDAQLALEANAASVNDWSWCRAALPDTEAKDWAWDHFTGSVPANAYELEAMGLGMWQPEQAELLAPYVDRYFADIVATGSVRQGWALASSSEFFYPLMALAPETAEATERVCADPEINPGQRRRLLDCADEVRRRLSVRQRYSS